MDRCASAYKVEKMGSLMLVIYDLFEFVQESLNILLSRIENYEVKTCRHGFNMGIWYNGDIN